MAVRTKKTIQIVLSLFLSGSVIALVGLCRGSAIAVSLSRPRGVSGPLSWTTSSEAIAAFTWGPIVIGLALILVAAIVSALAIHRWLQNLD